VKFTKCPVCGRVVQDMVGRRLSTGELVMGFHFTSVEKGTEIKECLGSQRTAKEARRAAGLPETDETEPTGEL